MNKMFKWSYFFGMQLIIGMLALITKHLGVTEKLTFSDQLIIFVLIVGFEFSVFAYLSIDDE